jgi:hypothetical protein
MPRDSFALEVNSNDDIDDFLTSTNIPWSRIVISHKEYTYLECWWPCVDTEVWKGGWCLEYNAYRIAQGVVKKVCVKTYWNKAICLPN